MGPPNTSDAAARLATGENKSNILERYRELALAEAVWASEPDLHKAAEVFKKGPTPLLGIALFSPGRADRCESELLREQALRRVPQPWRDLWAACSCDELERRLSLHTAQFPRRCNRESQEQHSQVALCFLQRLLRALRPEVPDRDLHSIIATLLHDPGMELVPGPVGVELRRMVPAAIRRPGAHSELLEDLTEALVLEEQLDKCSIYPKIRRPRSSPAAVRTRPSMSSASLTMRSSLDSASQRRERSLSGGFSFSMAFQQPTAGRATTPNLSDWAAGQAPWCPRRRRQAPAEAVCALAQKSIERSLVGPCRPGTAAERVGVCRQGLGADHAGNVGKQCRGRNARKSKRQETGKTMTRSFHLLEPRSQVVADFSLQRSKLEALRIGHSQCELGLGNPRADSR